MAQTAQKESALDQALSSHRQEFQDIYNTVPISQQVLSNPVYVNLLTLIVTDSDTTPTAEENFFGITQGSTYQNPQTFISTLTTASKGFNMIRGNLDFQNLLRQRYPQMANISFQNAQE